MPADNDKQAVQAWLAKAPFDDPKALAANPHFSYQNWIEEGRKLPHVVDVLVELLHKQNMTPTGAGERIAYALGWVGDNRAVADLVEALMSRQLTLRAESAAALGRIDDPRALAPLTRLVQSEKEDATVRANAAIALGQLGGAEAEAVLRKAAVDPDSFVARAATEGLRLAAAKRR